MSAWERIHGLPPPVGLRAVETDLEAEIVMADSSRPPGAVSQVDSTLSINPAELDQYKTRLHTLLDATHVAEEAATAAARAASQPGPSHRPGASGPTG